MSLWHFMISSTHVPELMKHCITEGDISYHVLSIAVLKSFINVYCFPFSYIVWDKILHVFSMGFKAILNAGLSNSVTLFFINYIFIGLEVWICTPNCRKTQSGPISKSIIESKLVRKISWLCSNFIFLFINLRNVWLLKQNPLQSITHLLPCYLLKQLLSFFLRLYQ